MKTKITRRKTQVIKIGKVYIGGNHPVAIQSMVKTKTSDIENTLRQIRQLEKSGSEIVRLAIKDSSDALALKKIRARTTVPLVADIHFNWRLALAALDNGADKIRLNPGNIYKKSQIKEIIHALKIAKKPLRIGVNSGSVKYWQSSRLSMPERLVKSALDYIKIIERLKFYDLVISLKASNVLDTLKAYRRLSQSCDYPFHLGLTATGPTYPGLVKSSITLGVLLLEGIGDTIRVSLTAQPQEEVKAAKYILAALGLRHFGPEIISCPTCGRCQVNLLKVVNDLEDKLTNSKIQPLQIAVMGCMVNGPGEAREADLGIAFGKKEGLLFKNGKALRKVPLSRCTDILLENCKA